MVSGQIDLNTGGAKKFFCLVATPLRKLKPLSDRACQNHSKESIEMSRKSKRTKGLEEARPFAGMSRVNEDAAGVDIGAVEIVVCVAGNENTQIVKAFGNYPVDLQNIGHWLK